MIRDEAAGTLRRYGETALWAVVLAGLVFGATRMFGIWPWVLLILALFPAFLLVDAIRRLRFPTGSGGVGVVQLDEGNIVYLARTGGMIAVSALDQVELHRNGRGSMTWVFHGQGQSLAVPGDAEGTETLFDALLTLHGVNYEHAAAARNGSGADMFLIWARDKRKLH